jgi:hypothetical protein
LKVGDRHLNPYEFRRLWTVPVTSNANIQQVDRSLSDREIYLEQKLIAIEEQFKTFQQQMNQLSNVAFGSSKNKGKGKGKGKKSQKTPSTEIEEEAQRRLRLFLSQQSNLAENFQSTSSEGMNLPPLPPTPTRASDDAWTNDTSSSHNFQPVQNFGPPSPTTKPIFLKRVELTINGSPIDMIEDKQTEDECMQMYWRMFKYTGQMNNLATNGISYSDFRYCKNYFDKHGFQLILVYGTNQQALLTSAMLIT